MMRWIVFAALFAAALGALVAPATAACSNVSERRLLPNGRFENVTRQDCYPDLHSAPMSDSSRDTAAPAKSRCRRVQERVLQPNGQFQHRLVERCS
jgi:hypothetical protein